MLVRGRPQIHLIFMVVVTIGGGGRQNLIVITKKITEIAEIILKDFFSKYDQILQETADLVTFTE